MLFGRIAYLQIPENPEELLDELFRPFRCGCLCKLLNSIFDPAFIRNAKVWKEQSLPGESHRAPGAVGDSHWSRQYLAVRGDLHAVFRRHPQAT
jgi:hypothetical protein